MELIKPNSNFDFIAKKHFAFVISLVFIVLAIFVWNRSGMEKYGIDYVGGHEIVVRFGSEIPKPADIRKSLEANKLENFVVQAFESEGGEYSIKIPGSKVDSSEVKSIIESALSADFKNISILKTDFVGPTIGSELKRKAIIAIIVGLIGILAYITIRFEFAYALGAVVALFHDVIVCMGIYLISGRTLSMATLAAALTIVGYSVNDTIILFDRVRENLFSSAKDTTLKEIFNVSINQTLSRTIITSLLTLFSALALLLYGGGAIADLSLFLVIGVIAGTYSTIFIASPVALLWEGFAVKNSEDKKNND